MTNRQLILYLIAKNSPSLHFRRQELIKWLVESGKSQNMAKVTVFREMKVIPVVEVVKGTFKLVINPEDFISIDNKKSIESREISVVETKSALIKEIVKYLNDKTGSKYKHNSTSTISKINARLNEGFTLDDFKTVINKKAEDWLGTNFESYLRPETLFSTKFESYLNQIGTTRNKSKAEQMAGYDFTKFL